ncbi:hypothetical protein ACGFN1_35615 [Streptomyces sp. NPDC048685]|uniref:hypothetical protein n=1 Tax=Streptomyces sp. NPDC048685 TaxID=3365584 RepID=UPI0037180005
MAILSLSVEQADQALREPWEGEAEALDAAAGAGRRAAAWVRSLPAPETDRWIVGPYADAVEKVMTPFDPGDCDDVDRDGTGGVDDDTTETLAGPT